MSIPAWVDPYRHLIETSERPEDYISIEDALDEHWDGVTLVPEQVLRVQVRLAFLVRLKNADMLKHERS